MIAISIAKRQRGAALIISLILLIAMTLIGISTLSGTRLNEKISSNHQQKAIAFDAAESALQSVWSAAYLRDQITTKLGNGVSPGPILQPDSISQLSNGFDQATTNGTIDVSGTLDVRYCGERPVVGGNLNVDQSQPTLVGLLVEVTSVAQIDNSSTQSLNVQRGVLTSVSTGRPGSCTAGL